MPTENLWTGVEEALGIDLLGWSQQSNGPQVPAFSFIKTSRAKGMFTLSGQQ